MKIELYDYIMLKVKELDDHSIPYTQEMIMDVYNRLLNNPCSLDEKRQIVDDIILKVIRNNEKKKLNEMAKIGEYSNFEKIKEVINIIIHSPLAPYITIYGGTVPYLITGKTPMRVIDDIDMVATVEDMPKIREIIKNHPDLFKVVLDSKDYTDDYGIELKINDIDVTIFTHEYTPEGRIVRNFTEDIVTNSIKVQAILFYGIFDDETTIEINMGDTTVRLECPEYVYIQKTVAKREKDKEDMKILSEIMDEDKLNDIKRKSNKPKVLVSDLIRLDKNLSQIKQNKISM